MTVARDSSTNAATKARRPGLSCFLKAFDAGLDRNRVGNNGVIPGWFSLTESLMASLVTCLLELEVEDMVGAELVRRFRQRERERAEREGGE